MPSTIESSRWWLPYPNWLSGVASIGGVNGLIALDRRRFHPAADLVLLSRDTRMLAIQFKKACKIARRELARQPTDPQQRLFDPDEE